MRTKVEKLSKQYMNPPEMYENISEQKFLLKLKALFFLGEEEERNVVVELLLQMLLSSMLHASLRYEMW